MSTMQPGTMQPGVITTADLYHEVIGTRSDLSRAMERMAAAEERDRATGLVLADHESRVRVLESFRWLVLGGATALGGAAGWLVSVLTHAHH